MSESIDSARESSVSAVRESGAVAALVMSLDATGNMRFNADVEPDMPDSTIYRMILTLGREFQRAIVEQSINPPSAALH